ncbi:hypothetical protein [Bacillus sp. FJAT-45350]|uniref:hypothetical protein n=1 Tax=Bacillus sp. FJAT-45350 TaxID=2011014 RepID=UPI000BB98F0A|nr:hypothetical protein [Bacillus sp. FJAT-45350]
MKRVFIIGIISFVLLLLSGCNLSMTEEATDYTLAADGIDILVMDLEKGDVEIFGEEGRAEIEVIASVVVVSDTEAEAAAFRENNIQVSLDKEGTEALLSTSIYQGTETTNEARVHLEIYVPIDLHVELKQTAGHFYVENMNGNMKLNHSSGDIIMNSVVGNIAITDGSGKIALNDIVGELEVNNGSGQFTLSNHIGNVNLIAGSGNIDISSVDGSVQVMSGTGAIVIDSIEKDVTIVQNSSGEVTVTNVKGTVNQ